MILAVRAQVLGQFVDPLGQQRDLDLGGAGVVIAAAVLADQLALFLFGQAHVVSIKKKPCPAGHGRWKLAQTRLASSTSRRICAIRSSTLEKRFSPRSRSTKATRSSWP